MNDGIVTSVSRRTTKATLFASTGVVDADDGVTDGGVGEQVFLDLLGEHLLAAAVDDVFDPIHHHDVAVGPAADQVTGTEVAARGEDRAFCSGTR